MYSIQVDIDVVAAARAVTLSHTAKHDLDMLLKTVLTEHLAARSYGPGRCIGKQVRLARHHGYSRLRQLISKPDWEQRCLHSEWQLNGVLRS